MQLELLRFSSTNDSTSGILSLINDDGSKEFLAYTIEDPIVRRKSNTSQDLLMVVIRSSFVLLEVFKVVI